MTGQTKTSPKVKEARGTIQAKLLDATSPQIRQDTREHATTCPKLIAQENSLTQPSNFRDCRHLHGNRCIGLTATLLNIAEIE